MARTDAGMTAPYFEDLEVGQVFDRMPAITITPGLAAAHLATFGDPLAMALSQPLTQTVTGRPISLPLANPALVMSVSAGQSTVVTRRVLANLFYRQVRFVRPVFVGDTLHTRVEILALRENRRREGRSPSGVAVLQVVTTGQHGEEVVRCERCPMLPMRGDEPTGRADELGAAGDAVPLHDLASYVPSGWKLGALAAVAEHRSWPVGETRTEELRDTVSSAREYVRLTGNIAMAHRDVRFGQNGARLVYGGHTVGLAQAALVRLAPTIVTVVAWRACDHLAPVFEEDTLETSARLVAEHVLTSLGSSSRGGRLLEFEVSVRAERAGQAGDGPVEVLRWLPIVLAT